MVVGLVEAGEISHTHAEAWMRLGVELLVHSPDGRGKLADLHDLEAVSSLDEMLERAEIVDLAASTRAHEPIVLAAIEAGRDIICQTSSMPSGHVFRQLQTAAAAASVQIYPAYPTRYLAPYVEAKAAVDAGCIGAVAVSRYFRETESPAEGTFSTEAQRIGVIRDLLLHDLDQARWMCGEVETVYAVQNPPSIDGLSPAFVSAHVSLTHAGGAITHIHATWGARGSAFKAGFAIAGSRGILEHSSTQNTGLTMEVPHQGSTELRVPELTRNANAHMTQLRDFANASRDGRPAQVDAEDGVMTAYLAEAAEEAVRTGRVVLMSEFIARAGVAKKEIL